MIYNISFGSKTIYNSTTVVFLWKFVTTNYKITRKRLWKLKAVNFICNKFDISQDGGGGMVIDPKHSL